MTLINVYTSAAQDGVGTPDAQRKHKPNTLIEEWNGTRKERKKVNQTRLVAFLGVLF